MRLVFLRFGCGGTSGIGRPENRKKRSAAGGTGRNRSSCVKNSMCRCRLIVKIKPVVQQAMSWKLKAKKRETSSIPCPFTADCKTRVTKAGLLTRSCFGAFPTRCQWQKSVETFCSLRSRNLQQRELLPILTAFPFNPLPRMDGGMGNLCRDKGNINFLAQRSTGSENSRPGRRRFRKREVWPAGEQASGSCGFRGRERRCVAVFSLSLRVIEYGG